MGVLRSATVGNPGRNPALLGGFEEQQLISLDVLTQQKQSFKHHMFGVFIHALPPIRPEVVRSL